MSDFLLPDLGEGLEEAQVIAWHVAVGDSVLIDQVVVEVETAKAAVEIPTPYQGVVSALHAPAGTTVRVGDRLITVEDRDLNGAPPTATTIESAPAGIDSNAIDVDTNAEQGSGHVLVGYGTSTTPQRRRPASHRRERGRPTPVISPLVRRLAREANVDLATITGSGAKGVIRRHDVDLAVERAQQRPGGTETRLPLSGLRRAIADKLTRSRREIPEATVWVDVDATHLLNARVVMNRLSQQPVSLLALLARFVVVALRRYPELNSRVENDEIVVPDYVNLGFATQAERGLLVPVVRNAHLLPTRALSAALDERINAARDGSVAAADLVGGTFTVNNYGVFGVDGSAAIINHPEVAILGMGRIIDRPWVVDGVVAVRKVTELTLAFDHRVCDGRIAGGFLRDVADYIENPAAVLAEI